MGASGREENYLRSDATQNGRTEANEPTGKDSETVGRPKAVDMSGLKSLARRYLLEGSKLRMLIESEKDEVPSEDWPGMVAVYCRLLEDEIRELG